MKQRQKSLAVNVSFAKSTRMACCLNNFTDSLLDVIREFKQKNSKENEGFGTFLEKKS